MLTVAGMEFIPFRDVTPFSFAFGNLVVAWGLFRYHLFDIIPIARDIVVENMEDLVVVLDMQDRVVDINSAALEALQMDSLQVLGQPAATIFAPWPELVEKFFEPENINTEISLSESDEINPFEIKSTILRDKKNRFTGRVFVARDVTERVNLQIKLEKLNYELEERVRERTKELQGSEERLRAIVDSAPFGAHLYQLEADERLVFIGANHSADDILQVDHQQFIGKTIEEAFPPLAETDIPAAYRAVATSGERFEMDQVDYEDAGIRGAFEIHAFQTGENRMAVFFRDITERKRAEEALIESEERFSTLAAASFEGIVISDKGRVIDCNEQLATILGYEQSEIVGLEVNKFVAPESLGIVLEHIKSGSEEPYEHLSLRKDGTKFPVEIRAKSIPFKGRQVRVTAIWDITERKKAEHDLLEAYDTTLKGWAKALELRDKETQDHSQRVTELTVTLARAMGVAEKDLIHFRRGAILHDIGKMGIPDEILRKRGPLTETEKSVVRQHPIHGYELLSPIPYLDKALDIPYCHHERWDGTGYPRGLKGEEIPLAARVFTVIDVWDALLSERPYSKAWSKKDTIQYLKDESGKIFDPECISLFLELVEQGKI
jgi:PAS domain S-box-containing protein/putative nucleotidyltransferase with HDIG domain